MAKRDFATGLARQVAQDFTDHCEMVVEPALLEILPTWKAHYGSLRRLSAVPTYYVLKITREHVTVALVAMAATNCSPLTTATGAARIAAGYDTIPRFVQTRPDRRLVAANWSGEPSSTSETYKFMPWTTCPSDRYLPGYTAYSGCSQNGVDVRARLPARGHEAGLAGRALEPRLDPVDAVQRADT